MASRNKVLREILCKRPPYLSGSLPVSKEDLILFYGRGSDLGKINFSGVTHEQLEHLSNYCEPAAFGLNSERVLDEEYRKAGKIDAEDFSLLFDVRESGLANVIRDQLLTGTQASGEIRVERYKLNVYGKDSFFKAHKDTPRSQDMFGSLVIVLPTPHEGGALVLRDNGKEWTFDSAAIIKDQTTPSIAFVAFYSDVEHEVMKVTSGHRVTITYNLYSGENSLSAGSIPFSIDPTRNELKSTLEAYLADDTFLPRGGYLGFGLRREYAFHNDRQKPVKLSQFESHLKGSDAILLEVCRELSLSASLNVYFITGYANYNELDVINTTIPVLSGNSPVEDEQFIELLCQYDGRLVKTRKEDHSRYSMSPELYIIWVTPRREFCSVRREVLAYGNEPSLSYAYGNLCLLVGIGPFGERGAVDKIRVPNYRKKTDKGATKPKK